ncbi:copper amine oxidase N-terminal domain-containing protein [Paenibacillus pinistramenti]|uniref:copper amine oxidase N-terminal domain-containing protein n=1 Tax=Paenibacillus pinistramenti TaxID=1768003 RepID=UPI0011098067|nr:copper amine oxidase N-terminal domain-containing protein [Paenibacillus pinistramenti]
MKRVKSAFKWLIPAAALLLVLAGCQPVSGLDVNKVLLGSSDVQSSESSLNVSMNMKPSAAATEEDKEIIDLINSFSLKLDDIKAQDSSTLSASGELDSSKLNIPFQLSINKDAMAVKVEGAKEPFYLPLTVDGSLGSSAGSGLGLDPDKSLALSKEIQSFLVNHLPNPSVINVSKVNETVHGEQLSLTKLHAEISGDELTGLLKTFLQSVSDDHDGLKALVSGLYDNLLPVLKEQGITSLKDLDSSFGDVSLNDKDAAVTEVYTKLQQALDLVVLSYDKVVNQALEEEPDAAALLSTGTKLSTDIYVDGDYKARKQNVEVSISLPDMGEELPLSSLGFKVESEQWNVNGAVQADLLDTANAIDITDETLTPGTILRNFDPQSEIYGVLKNDLGITQKYITIDPEYDDTIVKQNTTMIPLRYLAEYLDATVKTQDGKIVVTDDLSSGQLIFTPGSPYAAINGSVVKLPQPVFIDKYGRAYAPLRVLAEGLQAHVGKDSDGSYYVTRD